MARVLGSYPIGRWFKSYCRYHIWPVGQEVKTSPFHGGIMGSIPVRVTTIKSSQMTKYRYLRVFFLLSAIQFEKNLGRKPTNEQKCSLVGFLI